MSMVTGEISHLLIGVVSELHSSNPGLVRIKFPAMANVDSDWCSVVSPMGGAGRGFVMLPEVGDNVLVGFESGATSRGFVLGSVWNRTQKIPAGDGSPKDNNLRFIRSRSGHLIRFDDTRGKEKIEIIDKSTKQSIIIDASKNKIQITTDSGDISVTTKSGKVTVEASDISLKSTGAIQVEATGALTLKGATVNIN